MPRPILLLTYLCGILLLITLAYVGTRIIAERRLDDWNTIVPGVASASSSPRVVDLNQDGVKDIVFGAGGREYDHTENGVLALDGRNGQILWKVDARN